MPPSRVPTTECGEPRARSITTPAEFITLGDLSADNVVSVGISGPFDFADANELRSNNSSVEGVWQDIYDALNRVNVILEQVPLVTDLEETEKNQILGEAHALRALSLHNLTKFWGDVPMPLVYREERRGSLADHADAGGGGLCADPCRSRGGRDAGHRDR